MQDQLPSTHPVVADILDLEAIFQSFDGITYAKGASVLKQLVAYVGYDAFLAGVNRYFERHAWGNATLADLLAELEAASGRDLGAWARVWLQEPGVTTLQAHVELDGAGRYARVRDRAAARHAARGRVPGAAPAPGRRRACTGGPELDGTRAASCATPGSRWTCPGPRSRSPSWWACRRPTCSWSTTTTSPTPRCAWTRRAWRRRGRAWGRWPTRCPGPLVWGALWEQVRDLAMPAQEFVDVALAGLADEARPGIIDTVRGLIAAWPAPGSWPPSCAPTWRCAMCAGTAAMLDAAEPGSDRQLALARLHIESATDPQRLARLGDLLAGRAELPGLPLEDDLRWAAVIRCAALGAAGEELIDAELAADPTTRGAQFAAQARAAMPTAHGQGGGLGRLRSAGGLSNMALAATLAGFAHPDTPAGLLDPYRQRYVEQIAGPVHQPLAGGGAWPWRAGCSRRSTRRPWRPRTGCSPTPTCRRGCAGSCSSAGTTSQLALACQEVSRAAG